MLGSTLLQAFCSFLARTTFILLSLCSSIGYQSSDTVPYRAASIHIGMLYSCTLIMANILFLSNNYAVVDKKAVFYPLRCDLVDKKREIQFCFRR